MEEDIETWVSFTLPSLSLNLKFKSCALHATYVCICMKNDLKLTFIVKKRWCSLITVYLILVIIPLCSVCICMKNYLNLTFIESMEEEIETWVSFTLPSLSLNLKFKSCVLHAICVCICMKNDLNLTFIVEKRWYSLTLV